MFLTCHQLEAVELIELHIEELVRQLERHHIGVFDLGPACTGFASGPHLVRGRVKNDHKWCKPLRGKNPSGTREYTESSGAPHPSTLICNQQVMGSNPFASSKWVRSG